VKGSTYEGAGRQIRWVDLKRRIGMRRPAGTILALTCVFTALTAFGDWPPVVNSKMDVERLPRSTVSVWARGLPDADIPSLSRLPLLKQLDFGAGHKAEAAAITDKGLAQLGSLNFQKLEMLMLGYCTNITDAGLPHVARMQSLKGLSLMVCPRITDAGLRSLLSMTNLTYLDLRGCAGITDKGLEILSEKTNWETIALGGCPKVSEEAVGKLQRTLPKAKVQKDEREWGFHK